MARLEACYFCGTAEDELRAVTVTPRRRQDDPDAAVTLTLCRSCEGKLERVLDGLFEHVESRPTESSETDAAEADRPDETTADPEPEPIDRIDVSSSEPDDARPEGRREGSTDPPKAGESDDEGEASDGPDGEDAEFIDEEPRVTARATANAKDALDGVSVEEYNSVMRLLQNREFPMARDEFVDLAANAYDLGEGTVESVLDAVIDQGSLAERGGELVRPGNGESA